VAHPATFSGSIAYLGPPGTFTEEALRTQPDYASAEKLTALPTFAEVLDAVQHGHVDLGFVPIENALEGTVPGTMDSLVFDHELLIQREVVLDIHMQLMAPPGVTLARVRRVASLPHAAGQCRRFLAKKLPGAELVETTSTAEAARLLAQGGPSWSDGVTAAIAPRQAAALHGLDILAEDIEDHLGNQTRFVSVAREGVPAPTGHDRTSIVCFQRADRPGSLHSILGQFAAHQINLTKVESRPSKKGLGDYCFIIDLEGHLADEVVADCLRVLHAELEGLRFLGSYPAAGDHGSLLREEADAAWEKAADWVEGYRRQIRPS